MPLRQRAVSRFLPIAVLLAAACFLASAAAFAQVDKSLAHVDGYVSLSPDGRCTALRQHDGSLLTLNGQRRGLIDRDHVRLEGRMVADNRCGGQGGFEITAVHTIWADDHHKSTYYDHLKDGDFHRWLERNRPAEAQRRDRDR
jgi:hypothetical protein